MLQNRFTTKGFIVWGTCALFFLYEFLLRTVVGTFQVPIMEDLHLTSLDYSILSSTLYLITYGVMQIPAGIFVGSVGLKKSLFFACIVCAISSLGFAYSDHYISAALFRVLMGLGSSFGFICLLVSVYDWMPHRHSGLFVGLSQFIGTLGPMLGAGPMDSLAQEGGISWRGVFIFLTMVGVGIALLALLVVKNNQDKAGRYAIIRKPGDFMQNFFKIFAQWQPWFIAIFSAGVYFAVEYLAENEGKSFLLLKGFQSNTASYLITLSWLGYATGSLILGFLSDFTKRRKWVMVVSAFLCVVSTAIIVYSLQHFLITMAFYFLGFGAGGESVGFAAIVEHFKKQYRAIALSLNNAFIMLLAAVNAPLIGWFLECNKEKACEPLDHYYGPFSILVIFSVFALITALFFVRETYCKSQRDFTFISNS